MTSIFLKFLAGWCFTHQYKNTTQFCFYAGLAATQNTNQQNKISQGSYATLECIELASRTPFIDFHYNNSADDYTSRIIETNKGVLDVIGLLKNNGNSVATCSNDTVTFTNKGGHLLAKIGSVDIGCVPTVPEHTLNFIWNASLKRLYVNMDESQIGYLNILQ